MNKRLRKIALSTLMVTLFSFSGYAQLYDAAAGLRGGSLNGLTYKQFIGSNDAIEGILSTRWRGVQVTGLYQKHAQAFGVSQLQWYYGAGAHVGFYDGYDNHPFFDKNDRNESFVMLGIDGVIGIEYVIEEIPFVISVDWKPEFNIIGYSGLWFGDGGISIRYYW